MFSVIPVGNAPDVLNFMVVRFNGEISGETSITASAGDDIFMVATYCEVPGSTVRTLI